MPQCDAELANVRQLERQLQAKYDSIVAIKVGTAASQEQGFNTYCRKHPRLHAN